MIQSTAVTKQYIVVLESSLIVDADHMENDGKNLTFWDEAEVLIAKIPLSGVYTYDIQEVEVAI